MNKEKNLTEIDVENYLRNNPEFFIDRDNLLMDLRLPHESGSAVSLLERQITVLRQRCISMRHQLNDFVSIARDNDDLFKKTKHLVVELLHTNSIDEIASVLDDSFRHQFELPYCKLLIIGLPLHHNHNGIRFIHNNDAEKNLGDLLKYSHTVCGPLGGGEKQFIFGNEQAKAVQSVAITPLFFGDTQGMLALGSATPNHFQTSMGSLFLDYISEILSLVLARYLHQKDSPPV